MSKHTPGPYTRQGTNVNGVRRDVGYSVCIGNFGGFQSNTADTTIENEANAALFTAAPELAECLLALMAETEGPLTQTQKRAASLLENIGY